MPKLVKVDVPAELFLRKDMLKALDEWKWDVVLRAIVAATGWTQMGISRATGLSQPMVSRLMNGAVRDPKIQTVRALCDGLGIPRDLAGLAPTLLTLDNDEEEDATNRRDFVTGLCGITMGAALGRLPITATRGLVESEAEIRRLQDAAPKLLRMSDQLGGKQGLCDLGKSLVHRADGLLQHGSLTSLLTTQAQLLSGQLGMYTGWLYYDGGNQKLARDFWQYALQQAQFGDDALGEVYALESLSTQAAFFLNRPQDAISLARRAIVRASGWASPRLVSLLYMREAAGHAVRGDAQAFDGAYRSASNAFSASPTESAEDPRWLNFYTEAEVNGLRALSYMQLKDGKRAENIFAGLVEKVDPTLARNRLYYTTLLGCTMAENGHVEGAAEVLTPHLEEIRRTGSWRTKRHASVAIDTVRASRSSQTVAFVNAARELGL